MGAQFVEDLFHLECRGERLDEDSAADGANRDAEVGLRKVENVGPEAGFEIVLHFWQVEVGTRAVREEVGSIVEEVECEVEYGS